MVTCLLHNVRGVLQMVHPWYSHESSDEKTKSCFQTAFVSLPSTRLCLLGPHLLLFILVLVDPSFSFFFSSLFSFSRGTLCLRLCTILLLTGMTVGDEDEDEEDNEDVVETSSEGNGEIKGGKGGS